MQNPQVETDPRVPGTTNFYYSQEDILFKHCEGTPTQWNVTRPGWVIGAVKNAAMNLVYPLAVYAAVQQHRGLPLDFPGDYTAWDKEQDQSTAMLNCYFSEWAALTPEAGNNAFNVCDNCPFSWGGFWPVLASWYGIPWNPPSSDQEIREEKTETIPRGYDLRDSLFNMHSPCYALGLVQRVVSVKPGLWHRGRKTMKFNRHGQNSPDLTASRALLSTISTESSALRILP